jgi:hypothetical protein
VLLWKVSPDPNISIVCSLGIAAFFIFIFNNQRLLLLVAVRAGMWDMSVGAVTRVKSIPLTARRITFAVLRTSTCSPTLKFCRYVISLANIN